MNAKNSEIMYTITADVLIYILFNAVVPRRPKIRKRDVNAE
ncbi:hypothetical protein CJ739_143 [Mariniflexile rhizosphaerae]|nr:hypothetical protein CJ739_143 [Mariniflexile sp. TRM1-10]